jgi:hypothetical protein
MDRFPATTSQGAPGFRRDRAAPRQSTCQALARADGPADQAADGKAGSAFATAIVRKGGSAEIHCGFADKADADQLAELTGASAADPDSHWSSHRSFDVTAEKEVALTGLLAPNGDR